MDKICAVVDAQGFFIRDQFLAREAAFVSDALSHCQEFNPNVNWEDLKQKECKIVRHVRSRVHGFSLNAYKNKLKIVPESTMMINYLQQFYKILASEDKPYFGVKNIKLKEELKKAGIPVVDLSAPELGLPSVTKIETMYNSNWVCAYHTDITDNCQRCALRKCYNLWRFIKTKLYEETSSVPVQTPNDAHQSN